MSRVCVPLAEGFEEIEAITIVDVLRRADVDVVVAGVAAREVRGSHGITVLADALLGDVEGEAWDAVVLPGGLPGATNLRDDPRVQRLVANQHEKRALLGAICAAPIVLSTAGVLHGRAATSYPSMEEQLDCASYRREAVVVDGHVVTSRGPGTALAFALGLLRELGLEAASERLRESMLAP